MSGALAIFRRELRSLWVTPAAWIVLTAFLLLQGGIFYAITLHFSQIADASADDGPLKAYFGQQSLLMAMTLLLVCPALTMRSLAEERRSGTIEKLLSAPVSPAEIVLGKYAAALATYCLIWAPTGLYVLLLRGTGSVDPGAVVTGYLGVLLVGASYLALGILVSAMTKSQLVALMLAVLVQFGLFVVGLGEYLLDPGLARDLCAYLSLTSLLEETAKGLLDSRRLVLHGSLTAFALLATTRVVEAWRSA
jgi:ABC-2 type transport system permease protein